MRPPVSRLLRVAVARMREQRRPEDEASEVADVAVEAADKETEVAETAPQPGAPGSIQREY